MLTYPKNTSVNKRKCSLHNCGTIDYQTAWIWQKSLQKERTIDPERADALVILEHPPVYTLGTDASLDFVKFDHLQTEYELYRVERGGEVTYHCPGQIIVYPILNLRYYKQDLHWYLRQLEEVVLRVLVLNNLAGERIDGLTGVWLEGRKVAAIGIKVSRWVTMHGFALNVCPDLSGFDRIVPCGIADRSVGSMAEFIPNINPILVRKQIIEVFSEVFGLEMSDGREDLSSSLDRA
ncbi:lipoyl(octanoyl) transferase LipB [Chamaesiphon sp. GL140_3_metabinner_50]|uniref:lipoyl(octanoyl) transferase LipB n=1 Tax=Chamaesiphon sp. GL140_3_metabinner_50 TaxID=2970812 RepID=UPI0025E63DC3|nr:lipoyl(octanoyl) transferase LipB [Chamaesiphon sp. GL140_3_metabinner_50]